RSNRPGNSQANGPSGEATLESGEAGEARDSHRRRKRRPIATGAGESLRSKDRGGVLSGVRAWRRRSGATCSRGRVLTQSTGETLKTTPLHALHKALGARMVPFAGYDMPVQYPSGILKEHEQCRTKAALFDVSHMGQAVLRGPNVEAALETL